MTIRVTVKNEEAEGAGARLAVTVVTVGGNQDVNEAKHRLAAQESVTLHVGLGKFITVEETTKELL